MAKDMVAKKETALTTVSPMSFENFAGVGLEDVSTQDLAIPFLRILGQLSPQVNKRDGAYVKDAEAGMMYNTVLNEAYDGTVGVSVIPCYYNRRYVEWTPREKGGGYVTSYGPDDHAVHTTRKDDRNNDILPNGNLLTNTAQYFVLLLHPELGPQRCLITMTSTQLKKARVWTTNMQSLTARNSEGKLYTLPMMSHVYDLRTVPESNDKGNWFGWEITRGRMLDEKAEEDVELFQMAVAFSQSVRAGEVKVKEPTEELREASDNVPF